jgi:hypothetical protein
MNPRWNAPPGWPTPPEGWNPPEGWQPDPSWPPAPAGWQFTDVEAPRPINEAARPDVEAAVDRMGRTLGVKRELRGLEDRLDEGETVLELGRVEREGHGCLLVVTPRRILFLREGMIRNTVEEIPIRAITSVGAKRNLANGRLLVTVANNAEVWPMTSATHCERVSETIRQVIRQWQADGPAPIAQPAPAPAPADDLVEQIRRLSELRDAGALTDEEFAAAKKRLLV